MKKLLVTGGAGFIGSSFIRLLIHENRAVEIYNLDKLTYAGDRQRLADFEGDERYSFINGDICNRELVSEIMSKGIDTVVHFAAETHVDRSLRNAKPFIDTNVNGTYSLLEESVRFEIDRFIHISTDEVYGEINEGSFSEDGRLNPGNPYAASKASGDLILNAFIQTHGLPAVIVRPSNNYGPWQYPEKLIPLAIRNALKNQKVPVYAKGENIREWLYVDDCADAIIKIMEKGKTGEIYNLGSGFESRNINVVKKILCILGKHESLIEFVEDRKWHDFRYSLNSEKLRKETGWKPETDFDEGLNKTVKWYFENQSWLYKF